MPRRPSDNINSNSTDDERSAVQQMLLLKSIYGEVKKRSNTCSCSQVWGKHMVNFLYLPDCLSKASEMAQLTCSAKRKELLGKKLTVDKAY